MRVLIDECLDWRLCRALVGHQCMSVREMGWTGLTNGRLLKKAELSFDIFLTGDRDLRFQQNLASLDLAVVVLEARTLRLLDTMPLMLRVLKVLTTIQSREVVRIRQRR